MQRSELETEISRLLGDPSQTRWSLTVIDTRLDAAATDVQKYARAVKTTSQYTPTASSPYVTIGSKVIDILRASYTLPDGTIKNEKTGFRATSRWDLDFNRPNWENESDGEPETWFMDASNQRIVLVPKPAASSISTNNLTTLEVLQPAAMTGDTSIPFDSNVLMVPFHRALIYWVVAECLRDNQDTDSLNKAKYFRSDDRQRPGLYETEIKQIFSLYDIPETMPASVKFQPTGGRISGGGFNQKSNPLGWGLW